jgi:hypothetical protein
MLVIALITLGVGLLGHIVTTVWWASKITTILENALKSLMELSIEMKAVNKTYTSKEDFSREIGRIDKSQEAMWTKVDHLNDKVK